MPKCLLAIGSNSGDRQRFLRDAIDAIGTRENWRILAASRIRETHAAGGGTGQADYLNACLLLETDFEPERLLAGLQDLERQFGRVRGERWGARTLDLDLLLYDEISFRNDFLQLPHPRMSFRRFVLEPAVEIAPHLRHPTSGCTLAQLLTHLNSTPNYLALADQQEASMNPRREALLEAIEQQGIARCCRWPRSSAGSTLPISLEFAREIAERIRGELDSCHKSTPWLISDFWLDEMIDGSNIGSLPGGCDETARSSSRMAQAFPVPKLMVTWDTTVAAMDSGMSRAPEHHLEGRKTVWRGPQLAIPAHDLAWCVAEIAGAIQAMQ